MSAPIRPCEVTALRNFQYPSNLHASKAPLTYRVPRPRLATQDPPLPPRNGSHRSYGVNRNGALGYGAPPLFSAYGMYNGYGIPYGSGYGIRDDYDSRFIQAAEEATNGTFQSIESFVRAFSSITMMLESTYQALHMSFRSVLSVADNMAKLKSVAVKIISSISILKFLYWLYRRILYMLGLVNSFQLVEENTWNAAECQVSGPTTTLPDQISTWPLIGLFGLMLSAPYFIYRALAPQIHSKTLAGWDPSTGIKVKAICDFDCPTKGEIPFKKGEILVVPADFKVVHGWSIAKLGNALGYIPADRVAILPPAAKPNPSIQKNVENVDVSMDAVEETIS